MALQFELVTSLDQIDFDTLFYNSSAAFDRNFPWHLSFPGIEPSYELKKNFYLNQLNQAILGTSPLRKENEKLLMFKVLLDDKLVMFKAGYIESDQITHRGHWFLTDTDSTGSRNWMYTPELDEGQRNFYAQFGITHHKVLTYVGADLYRMMKSRTYYVQTRGLAGRAVVIDEQPMDIVPLENSPSFVVLTVQL